MQTRSFERFGGTAAILAGISAFLYAVSFIILRSAPLAALFLMLIGFLSTAALTALYYRLRAVDAPFALWALWLGVIGAVGTTLHGGYDLANYFNPPEGIPTNLIALPSQVDPRGLLTFGFVGISLFVFSWLMTHRTTLPAALGYLGYLSALLLMILYLGRLIVLNPSNPLVLIPAVLHGFIVGPLWYLWLGIKLVQPAMVQTAAYHGAERRAIERRQAEL